MVASIAAVAVSLTGAVSAQQPILTEFLARNDVGIQDEDNERNDWIEIHNPSASALNLGGWRLTDDGGDLSKWVLPSQTLGPGEFLVVFASGKDRAVAGQPLHTNFRLSAGGEYLALVSPVGLIATQFSPTFPAQTADVSYGYESDLVTLAFFDPPHRAQPTVAVEAAPPWTR